MCQKSGKKYGFAWDITKLNCSYLIRQIWRFSYDFDNWLSHFILASLKSQITIKLFTVVQIPEHEKKQLFQNEFTDFSYWWKDNFFLTLFHKSHVVKTNWKWRNWPTSLGQIQWSHESVRGLFALCGFQVHANVSITILFDQECFAWNWDLTSHFQDICTNCASIVFTLWHGFNMPSIEDCSKISEKNVKRSKVIQN